MPCCSGERWVGRQTASGGSTGSPTGYEPVAIKTIALDAAGVQEQDSMIKVQQVLETQAGPHHLAELVGTYLQPDPDTGAATHILIVTRYPPWPSSFFSALPKQSSATWPHLHLTLPHKVLRNLLEESSGTHVDRSLAIQVHRGPGHGRFFCSVV